MECAERRSRRAADGGGRVGGEVGHLDHRLGKAGRDGGHGRDRHRRAPAAVAPGEVGADETIAAPAVRGGADLQEAQRIGHHRRRQHLVGGDLLAVAGVGVGQPVAGVLHLDGGEVVLGGAEELHAAAGVQGEVRRVGGPEKVEAQPVGIVLALAADRGEEALGGGVGPDHEGHVAQAGQDLGAGRGRWPWPPRRRPRRH